MLNNLNLVNLTFSIDASRTDCLAKMVNDQIPSKTNCKMKKMVLDGKPRLLLYATKNIKCGKELRYDYGVGDLPWRRQHELNFSHLYVQN